jgi:hypothetical protein
MRILVDTSISSQQINIFTHIAEHSELKLFVLRQPWHGISEQYSKVRSPWD